MSSSAAIRIADHLRPILFSYVFVEGLSVREAVERVSQERRVFIPKDVADALVREENARRSAAQGRANTAKLSVVAQQIEIVKKVEFELLPRGGHAPNVAYVKGNARVTCSCGAPVCALPRADVEGIERAWYVHRDGTPDWKKE